MFDSDGPVPCGFCKEARYYCRCINEDDYMAWSPARLAHDAAKAETERQRREQRERENAADPDVQRIRREYRERQEALFASMALHREEQRQSQELRNRQIAYLRKHGRWIPDDGDVLLCWLPEGWENEDGR